MKIIYAKNPENSGNNLSDKDKKKLENAVLKYYFEKWRKNSELIKAQENVKIIRDFFHKKMALKMQIKSLFKLKELTKKLVLKRAADVLGKLSKINESGASKLFCTLENIYLRDPLHRLMKGLRWKIFSGKTFPKTL